jgi:hypothetical protein
VLGLIRLALSLTATPNLLRSRVNGSRKSN